MPVIVSLRCPYCQKFRSPLDIIHQPGGVEICVDCEQKHQAALEALSSGQYNGECSECGKPCAEANVLLEVHYENGKYRLMCLKCSAAYTPKRKELYAGTQFAHEQGLN
jgi:hypothetical protein